MDVVLERNNKESSTRLRKIVGRAQTTANEMEKQSDEPLNDLREMKEHATELVERLACLAQQPIMELTRKKNETLPQDGGQLPSSCLLRLSFFWDFSY